MKKNKLLVFLFGVVATVSSVLIVVSILISSGAAGLDSLFTEKEQQISLPEMEKNDFVFSGDTGDLTINEISVSQQMNHLSVLVDLSTNINGIDVLDLHYEIIGNDTNYTGTVESFDESSESLENLSSPGDHRLMFSVWHRIAPSSVIRVKLSYKNAWIDPQIIHSCIIESGIETSD